MKKLVAAILPLLTSLCAYALPVGNPVDASSLFEGIFWEKSCADGCDNSNWSELWSLRIGFCGDYVFDRHLKQKGGNDQDIANTKIFTNSGYWALNFCNRIDLFGTLGATEFRLEARTTNFFPSINIPVFIETQTHLSWSIGLRGTLWECGCFGVGVEGQYFKARPDIRFVRTESFPATFVDDVMGFEYREWQVGFGASYRLHISCATALVPYVALKWSHVRVDLHNLTLTIPVAGLITLFDLKNANHLGYAVGLTLAGGNRACVTVEGRFADEKAVYVNSQFRF